MIIISAGDVYTRGFTALHTHSSETVLSGKVVNLIGCCDCLFTPWPAPGARTPVVSCEHGQKRRRGKSKTVHNTIDNDNTTCTKSQKKKDQTKREVGE